MSEQSPDNTGGQPPATTPQPKSRTGARTLALSALALALCAGGGYLYHQQARQRELEQAQAEQAKALADMEQRHKAEMELRAQRLKESIARKEQEIHTVEQRAEERSQAWIRQQEEAKRQAEELRRQQEERERAQREARQLELRKQEELRLRREQLLKDGIQAAKEGRDADACDLYRQAVDLGSAEAAHDLGARYVLGKGVKKDLARGAELYKISAEGGYAEGQLAYGRALLEGRGVDKDAPAGMEWVEKAAAQGLQDARDLLEKHQARERELARAVYPDLQPLIDRMRALKCKQAVSAEQQRHLLEMLPQIRDGADVDMTTGDSAGHTALHYSCGIGSLSITRWLVNHGADVNAAAYNGDTPLSCVGDDHRAEITNLLLQKGASTGSSATTGGSPAAGGSASQMLNFISAAPCRNSTDRIFQTKLKDILGRVARNGADINEPLPGETNTALHYASAMNQPVLVEWLLRNGAYVNVLNKRGESPADCARAQGSYAALEVLRAHGGN